eukprot:1779556-Lingulodinium_polyedra.AAC.1
MFAIAVHPAVDRALDRFPDARTRASTSWTRAGLPLQVLEALGQGLIGGQWAQGSRVVAREC